MASKAKRRADVKLAEVSPSKPSPVPVRRSLLWVGLIVGAIAIAGVVYYPALDGPFIFDDFHLPFSNPDANSQPLGFWFGGVRPVLMASYWINYQVSGTRPLSYHL